MSKAGPTKEAFAKLLNWLHPELEKAGEKYETIRLRLIGVLVGRGCHEAEDLADETINVVAARIDWLIQNYQGDPSPYFYGVAKNIFREYDKKRKRPPPAPPPPPDVTEIERECACLERCLKVQLTAIEQRVVLLYHEKMRREKIIQRRQLAEELGISINALRIRVHHLHLKLRPCIEQCLKHLES